MLSDSLTKAEIKILVALAFFAGVSFLNGDVIFGIIFILVFIAFLGLSIFIEIRKRKGDEHRKYKKRYHNRL